MSNEATALVRALHQKFGFETVKETGGGNQVRLLGRVPKEHARNWLVALQHLLVQESKAEWSVDVSRQYFLRGNVMAWGWRLIFQSKALPQDLPSILASLGNAPRAPFELEEQPLPGVTGQRNMMGANGKGASSGGSTPQILQGRRG